MWAAANQSSSADDDIALCEAGSVTSSSRLPHSSTWPLQAALRTTAGAVAPPLARNSATTANATMPTPTGANDARRSRRPISALATRRAWAAASSSSTPA